MYSVVIATRQKDPLLVEALDSILAQSVAPGEVLVVSDQEDHINRGWSRPLKSKFPTVRFVVQDGKGQAAALAYGIANAQHEFIAFLDSDDLWQPEKQRMQIKRLRERPNLDAVQGLASNRPMSPLTDTGATEPRAAATFTACTFRTDTFRRFGTPDPDAPHQTWLYRWWANARHTGIQTEVVPHLSLVRRIHQQNSWRTYGQLAHRELLKEIRKICESRARTKVRTEQHQKTL